MLPQHGDSVDGDGGRNGRFKTDRMRRDVDIRVTPVAALSTHANRGRMYRKYCIAEANRLAGQFYFQKSHMVDKNGWQNF